MYTVLSIGVSYASLAFVDRMEGNTGKFRIVSTPAVYENRVFIQTKFHFDGNYSAQYDYFSVYAVDIREQMAPRMIVAWNHTFKAERSANQNLGSHPSVFYVSSQNVRLICYSFVSQEKWNVECLLDSGKNASIQFSTLLPELKGVSLEFVLQNEKNLLWCFIRGQPTMLAVDVFSGNISQKIDLRAFLGDKTASVSSQVNLVSSIVSPTETLLFGAQTLNENSLVYVDVSSFPPKLIWSLPIGGKEGPQIKGQQNLLSTKNESTYAIVFSTFKDGVYCVGN